MVKSWVGHSERAENSDEVEPVCSLTVKDVVLLQGWIQDVLAVIAVCQLPVLLDVTLKGLCGGVLLRKQRILEEEQCWVLVLHSLLLLLVLLVLAEESGGVGVVALDALADGSVDRIADHAPLLVSQGLVVAAHHPPAVHQALLAGAVGKAHQVRAAEDVPAAPSPGKALVAQWVWVHARAATSLVGIDTRSHGVVQEEGGVAVLGRKDVLGREDALGAPQGKGGGSLE